MKILIVSDTHGRLEHFREVLEAVSPVNYLIHCGDIGFDKEVLEEMAGCPSSCVKGNNDFGTPLPMEEELAIAGRRMLIVHGHRHRVHYGYEGLYEAARARNCDTVIFGHTHEPCLNFDDPKISLINPGSLSLPRQNGRRPSYIIMSADRNGHVMFTLNYLKKEERGWYY